MGHFLALVVVWWSGSLLVLCLGLWCCRAVCHAVSGGLVLSLVVFSGLVVSGSGSGSLWRSLCLWWSLCGSLVLCVWWSGLVVCRAVSRAGTKKKITEHEKDVPLNDTSPFAYLHYKILFLFIPLSVSLLLISLSASPF